jgi:hypothetical protein
MTMISRLLQFSRRSKGMTRTMKWRMDGIRSMLASDLCSLVVNDAVAGSSNPPNPPTRLVPALTHGYPWITRG